MEEIVGALRAQQAELAAVVARRSSDELLAPSRCDGWSVADVLLHLAQTDELAVASVEGRLGALIDSVAATLPAAGAVDDWAGAHVAAERGDPVAARDRWMAASEAEAAAFADCGPSDRVQWVAGEMAARTLCTTRLAETWIHTVDVAVAFGPEPEPTERLHPVARLAWRTIPYALAQGGEDQHGPVRLELTAPDGSAWTFGDEGAPTVIRGSAHALCTVAGQRGDAASAGLSGEGPDADAVLRLVRTFA